MTSQAPQVLLHDGLAFGFVIEREATSFRRNGFAEFRSSARSSQGRHDGCCPLSEVFSTFGDEVHDDVVFGEGVAGMNVSLQCSSAEGWDWMGKSGR